MYLLHVPLVGFERLRAVIAEDALSRKDVLNRGRGLRHRNHPNKGGSLYRSVSDYEPMPLERNLMQVDESCPECGTVLEEDPHDRLWCRDCGERKTV